MNQRVVIVGAGHSGTQLAIALRQRSFGGGIILFGDEATTPYQRPPLSKTFLRGEFELVDLAFKPLSYFVEKKITLLESTRVAAIDRASQVVRAEDGHVWSYDHLVLATGARNRRLSVTGVGLTGVVSLRTLDEARALRSLLSRSRKAVVIGAGFIGMEFAAIARQLGVAVAVVERADHALARAVSKPISDYLVDRHRAAGVTFHFRTGVQCFEGTDAGAVCGLRLTDESLLTADLVLVAVGVEPNVDLAMAAALPTENGVIVDDMLTTEDPAVHAIGDCANYPHSLLDRRSVRVESVQNAADHARCLAATLSGTPTRYERVPWFWSDQWDIRLQIAGIADMDDESVVRGDPKSGRFSVFRLRKGRLTAVESINQSGEHMAARFLVQCRPLLTRSNIQDARLGLKDLAGAAVLET